MSTPALVLDFGGPVLLTPFELVGGQPGTAVHELLHERGPLAPADRPDQTWESLQRGSITERDYWAERAVEWDSLGGHGADIRAMIAHLYEPPRPELVREQARGLVRDAHQAGLKVGILTNDLRAFHSQEWIDGIEIVGDVDVVVDGSVEGHLKPAPRLYELLSERLEVSFADMVFLDDQTSNIRGAEALGIPSVWFDVADPDTSYAEVRKLLGLEGGSRMVEQRELLVTQMTLEAEGVLSLRLERIESNDPLPVWEPGAHIDVYVPDGSTRQYSLCSDPRDLSNYQVAVLREPAGRGGSQYIHDELRVGQRLLVTRPKQGFALEDAPFHALVAGGVGITPIMAFAEHLDREGRPFQLTYGGRTHDTMAFRGRLGTLGERARFLAEDTDGRPDLDEVVKQLPDGGLVYVCGPLPLLRAVEAAAERVHGPDQDIVRFELFSSAGVERPAPVPLDGDSYELVLAKSGHTLRMRPDANILETVLALGVEVENDCRDGICGSCVTPVLAGTVDHQDLVLTRREQAAMDKMMICCSKPTCDRLELDL